MVNVSERNTYIKKNSVPLLFTSMVEYVNVAVTYFYLAKSRDKIKRRKKKKSR